jgi:hypothetical protein
MEKTLVFFLFILTGYLLKTKFQSKEETLGIKKIILNLALPATIFMALLSIEINQQLLLLPVLSLGLNLLLFLSSPWMGRLAGIKKGSAEMRTLRLLIPSLAPGLSCFPFVLEYLGEEGLAKVAMADLGNKVFVLFVLFWVAMLWHRKTSEEVTPSGTTKPGALLKRFISEPVNLFISAALLLLALGIDFSSLPLVLQDTLGRLGGIMTPLVLLFIGLSVKIKREQFRALFALLSLRAASVFLLVASILFATGLSARVEVLLLLCFSLSACSFWPFAHITTVSRLEEKRSTEEQTFNPAYAINLLALSFPMSTVLILGVLNSGSSLTNPWNLILIGGALGCLGLIVSPNKIKINSLLKLSPDFRSTVKISRPRKRAAHVK